jgi:hypothetical protein
MKKNLLIPGLVLLAAFKSTAQVDINFDSVNANIPGGVDATSYLASYGITLTGLNPTGGAPNINSDTAFFGSGVAFPSSPPNFLLQQASSTGESYTMQFGAPLSEVQFYRVGTSDTTETPIWSATAYDGAAALGSVGESSIDAFTGSSAKLFTMSYAGSEITSLTFYGNGEGSAALYGAAIDDLTLYAVPEPSTLALVGLSGLSWLSFRRQRR